MLSVRATRLVFSLLGVQNAFGADVSSMPRQLKPPLKAHHCAELMTLEDAAQKITKGHAKWQGGENWSISSEQQFNDFIQSNGAEAVPAPFGTWKEERIVCHYQQTVSTGPGGAEVVTLTSQIGDCETLCSDSGLLGAKKHGEHGQTCCEAVGEARLKPWGDLIWTGNFDKEFVKEAEHKFGDVSSYTRVEVDAENAFGTPPSEWKWEETNGDGGSHEMTEEEFVNWMGYGFNGKGDEADKARALFSTVPGDLFGIWKSPFDWDDGSDLYNIEEMEGAETEKAKSDWEHTQLAEALYQEFELNHEGAEGVMKLSDVGMHIRKVMQNFYKRTAQIIKADTNLFAVAKSLGGDVVDPFCDRYFVEGEEDTNYENYVICELFSSIAHWTIGRHSPELGGIQGVTHAPNFHPDFLTTYDSKKARTQLNGRDEDFKKWISESVKLYKALWDPSNLNYNVRHVLGMLYKIADSKWLKPMTKLIYCHTPRADLENWMDWELLTQSYWSLLYSDEPEDDVEKKKTRICSLVDEPKGHHATVIAEGFNNVRSPHILWTPEAHNPSQLGTGGVGDTLRAPFQAIRGNNFRDNKNLLRSRIQALRPPLDANSAEYTVLSTIVGAKVHDEVRSKEKGGEVLFGRNACNWYATPRAARKLYNCMHGDKKFRSSEECWGKFPPRFPGKNVLHVTSLVQAGWLQLFNVSGTTTDLIKFVNLINVGDGKRKESLGSRDSLNLGMRVGFAIYYMGLRQHSFMEVMLAADNMFGIDKGEYGLKKTMSCVQLFWTKYSLPRKGELKKLRELSKTHTWNKSIEFDGDKANAARIIAQCLKEPTREDVSLHIPTIMRRDGSTVYVVTKAKFDGGAILQNPEEPVQIVTVQPPEILSDPVKPTVGRSMSFLQSLTVGLAYLPGAEDGTSFIWYVGGVVVVGLVILATIGAVNPKGRKAAANNSGDDDQAEDWKDSGDEVSGKQALLEAM